MTNLESIRGAFDIPSSVIDEYNWISDGLIDNVAGVTCTLYYPPNVDECDNCYFDSKNNRSSNIYKTGGPIPFTNFTLCPRCHGRGLLTSEPTEDITLRVYYESSSFIDIGVDFKSADGVVMIIGYMKDLPKIENATKILLNSNLEGIRRYFVVRMSECVPYGLDKKRYFLGYFKREGGG